MKSKIQYIVLGLLMLGVMQQAYVFLAPKVDTMFSDQQALAPLIPRVPITLLDESVSTIADYGAGKQTLVFIVRSNCFYCQQELEGLRENYDYFNDTQILFISFEELEVIANFKASCFKAEVPFVSFARAQQSSVSPLLIHGLAFPYLLWYDHDGTQKLQHKGYLPVERIVQAMQHTGIASGEL